MVEERKESYGKNTLVYLIALFLMVISWLFNFRMTHNIGLLVYWGIYACQYMLFRRVYKKELISLISVIAIYFILSQSDKYIKLDIVLAIYFAILAIYYALKDITKYKWQKVLAIALIIPLAVSINFYGRKDKLIKDRALERCIKEELLDYGYKGKVTSDALEMIDSLYISGWDYVYNLEGIENLKNLRRLEIYTANIKDLSCLESLSDLKYLKISYGKLEKLTRLKELGSLEELEIGYIDVNNVSSIDNFPNIKSMSIQGIDLKNLSLVKEIETLEKLRLSFCEINTLDGLEYLTNLKRIEFFNSKVENIYKIREAKSLKTVDINSSEIGDIEELKKSSDLIIINRPDPLRKLISN